MTKRLGLAKHNTRMSSLVFWNVCSWCQMSAGHAWQTI